jgi:hypothetical protein
MQSIYQALDAIDAQRVVDLLGFEGITATVHGAYLSGAMGELPMQGLVSVWVADGDAARAQELIAAEREAMAAAADPETPAATPVRGPTGSPWAMGAVGLVLGLAMGAGLTYRELRQPESSQRFDSNNDGIADVHDEYAGRRLIRTSMDRNGDGHYDQVDETPEAAESVSRYDDDFDGTYEGIGTFKGGQLASLEQDLDDDGYPEWRHVYQYGVIAQSYLREPAGGAMVKRQSFTGGVLVLEEFDADGDGSLETRRHFDSRGELLQ